MSDVVEESREAMATRKGMKFDPGIGLVRSELEGNERKAAPEFAAMSVPFKREGMNLPREGHVRRSEGHSGAWGPGITRSAEREASATPFEAGEKDELSTANVERVPCGDVEGKKEPGVVGAMESFVVADWVLFERDVVGTGRVERGREVLVTPGI